jgi:hypothetical protein
MRSWIRPTIARRFVPLLLLFLMITPVVFADDGPAHRVKLRPAELGVSGGNINDLEKAFCYGGTLGMLVQRTEGDTTTQFILSNNHVLARSNRAAVGDAITQPGLIDAGCRKLTDNTVANLSGYVPLAFKSKGIAPNNYVDAAIAKVVPNTVRADGSILDIGTLAATTKTVTLDDVKNQTGVKKSGRTTGLTRGTIAAVGVDVDVNYGSGKVAHFVNQIMIGPGAFSSGGDSGSAVVTDVSPSPQVVGLLFAGTGSQTIANPIGEVLNRLNVNIVGAVPALIAPSPSSTTSTQEAVAQAAKQRNKGRLMSIPGAVGVGIGRDGVIELYLAHGNEQARSQIPEHVDNIPVRVIVTGEFQAY